MTIVDNVARAFAPAGVGNIGIGFDLLGHSIDGPRDVALVRRIDEPVVRIRAIGGDVAGAESLPLDPARNTAGHALVSLRALAGVAFAQPLVVALEAAGPDLTRESLTEALRSIDGYTDGLYHSVSFADGYRGNNSVMLLQVTPQGLRPVSDWLTN